MFFDLEKNIFSTDRKTVWHIHCGKWVLHKFNFLRESEQFWPLSAQHLDVKELTQNVSGVFEPWRIQSYYKIIVERTIM